MGQGEINFRPTVQQDAGYHLRVTLSQIAGLLDQYTEQGLPYGFIAFQNESQSEGIILRVVRVVRTMDGDGDGDGGDGDGDGGDEGCPKAKANASNASSDKERPALICIYMYNTAGNPESVGRCMEAAINPLAPALGNRVLSAHKQETEVVRMLHKCTLICVHCV